MRLIKYSNRNGYPLAGFGGRFGSQGLGGEFNLLLGSALGEYSPLFTGQFPVDLYEDKDNTYVRAELPGVNREAISVEIVDGTLSIKASRTDKTDQGEKTVTFSRAVGVSDDAAADKVTAAYENGVLTVTLPRKEEAKPKKVTVSVN